MKKEKRHMEEIDRFIGKTFGMSQAENSRNKLSLNSGKSE